MDDTVIRAHQHAAGARSQPSAAERKGLLNPEDEALGRSRGGFSTKLHLACDGKGRPLSVVVVTPGQRHGSTQLQRLLDGVRVGRPAGLPGRPRKRPDHVIADTGVTVSRVAAICCDGVASATPSPSARTRRSAVPGVGDADLVSTGKLTAGATWSRGA